ncbi:unnamed protein product [Phaeothamnion confervicola]
MASSLASCPPSSRRLARPSSSCPPSMGVSRMGIEVRAGSRFLIACLPPQSLTSGCLFAPDFWPNIVSVFEQCGYLISLSAPPSLPSSWLALAACRTDQLPV